MTSPTQPIDTSPARTVTPQRLGFWIAVGLLLGLFWRAAVRRACAALALVGQAYVGLLQMTVLPYLILSLVAKTGRLDLPQARKLGITVLVVLLVLWLIGIVLIVLVSLCYRPWRGRRFTVPCRIRLTLRGRRSCRGLFRRISFVRCQRSMCRRLWSSACSLAAP